MYKRINIWSCYTNKGLSPNFSFQSARRNLAPITLLAGLGICTFSVKKLRIIKKKTDYREIYFEKKKTKRIFFPISSVEN